MLKKLTAILLAVLIIVSSSVTLAFAEDEVPVFLRVEGINRCLYNDSVNVKSGASVYDALVASGLKHTASKNEYSVYVSEICGEKEKTFASFDGWLYKVDGALPDVDMGSFKLNGYEEILIYYGDPYGIGMQFPEIDASELNSEGIIMLTSNDTVYDSNWNAIETTNPVSNCTLYFDDVKLISDENGIVSVPESLRTEGEHKIQIEKFAENGCPLVLRLPDNTYIVIGSGQENDDPVNPIKPGFSIKSAVKKILKVLKSFYSKMFSLLKKVIKK